MPSERASCRLSVMNWLSRPAVLVVRAAVAVTVAVDVHRLAVNLDIAPHEADELRVINVLVVVREPQRLP